MKKKIFLSIIIAALFAMMIPMTASAVSGNIDDINITVTLGDDGTAYMKEIWDVTVDSDFTEWYLVKDNLDGSVISDFSVTDENGTVYQNEGDWDINRTKSEKAGKCGIVDKGDGSYELCWGVGSDGDHVYTVTYTMSNVVNQYTDGYDGFNQRFINEGLSSTPEHMQITIKSDSLKFTSKNTGIWAFGYKGAINFQDDGTVIAESDGQINYANIMMRFDDGMFTPTNISSKSFEQVRATAFKGSDYSDEAYKNGQGGDVTAEETDDGSDAASVTLEVIKSVLIALFALVSIGIPFILAKATGIYSKSAINKNSVTKEDKKNLNYHRDIPMEGKLQPAYAMLQDLKELPNEGSIISAYLLRWLENGCITVTKTERKKVLGMFGDSMQNSIIFEKGCDEFVSTEKELYLMLKKAAGGDNILQEKEFYKWSKAHYEDVSAWLLMAHTIGYGWLEEQGAFDTVEMKVLFVKREKQQISAKGKEYALELLGFRKYLKDFTIINERTAAEVELWNDYLVYAAMFGIADEVAKEFKELSPEYFTSGAYGNMTTADTAFDFFITMQMLNCISTAGLNGFHEGYSAAQMATSSSGGGGFSSLGGGGGFSGGGFGGGGR